MARPQQYARGGACPSVLSGVVLVSPTVMHTASLLVGADDDDDDVDDEDGDGVCVVALLATVVSVVRGTTWAGSIWRT